jgi:hypothetical protein
MNESRESRALLEEWGHLDLAQLPPEARARVDACPVCRAHFERKDRLVALLALKRHELPDPAFEGRLLHRVGTRLRQREALETVRPREVAAPEAGRWAWMGPLALAAALAVAVGVNQYTLHDRLASEAALAATPVAEPASPVADGMGAGPPSITEAEVRGMFAVTPTTSNQLERLVQSGALAGWEVIDARTNGVPAQAPGTSSGLVPVRAPSAP